MIHKEMKYQTFNDRKSYAAKRFFWVNPQRKSLFPSLTLTS